MTTPYTSSAGDTWERLTLDQAKASQMIKDAQAQIESATQFALDVSCRLTAWQDEQKHERKK